MNKVARNYCLVLLSVRKSCSQPQSFLSWPRKDSCITENLDKLEKHWHNVACSPSSPQSSKGKKYVLSMFPYPSGNLHMGHMRVYTISDVLARYYRLNEYDVIHPIGWDAFGLPAENAARDRGIRPEDWTFSNIETMRKQLLRTGIIFDWDREIFTCTPDYYRWTQWLFLQLHSHQLAHRLVSEVNWDPIDKTVLAEEQIDSNGRSWRSGARVEKRKLKQWHIKTTKYAKRLLEGLKKLDHWEDIADIQANWIGKCDVWRFLLPIKSKDGTLLEEPFDLRIREPSELAKSRMIVIREGHPLCKKSSNGSTSLLNVKVVNVVTGCEMPVVFLQEDSTSFEYFLNARLANLNCDTDLAVARKFNISLMHKQPSYSAESIIEIAQTGGYGGYQTSEKLLDWVVSRQRHWGAPIPVLLDEKDREIAVPVLEKELPVLSNQVKSDEIVVCTRLPSGVGVRETDTLDTFFDSSWYFLRYLDPRNDKALVGLDKCKLMPVDVYVGGIEHAAVHMFFARFMSYFLYDIGVIETPEPFDRILPQGVVRSRTFVRRDNGQFLKKDEVVNNGNDYFDKAGNAVDVVFEKMSKSKHNGVDPFQLLSIDGVDITRLQLIDTASPRSPIDWGAKDSRGTKKWLNRVSSLVNEYVKCRYCTGGSSSSVSETKEEELRKLYNDVTRNVSTMLEVLNNHYGALIRLHEFASTLKKQDVVSVARSKQFERCLHALVIMMQVIAPHIANEFWSALCSVPALDERCRNKAVSVCQQIWPVPDADANIDFIVKTMRISCGRVAIPRKMIEGCNAQDALQLAKDVYHCQFFELVGSMGFEPIACKAEEYKGLIYILTLEFDSALEEGQIRKIASALAAQKKKKKKMKESRK